MLPGHGRGVGHKADPGAFGVGAHVHQHRFPVEPWRLVERSYSNDDLGTTETLFALGTGYLGMRANPEEGREAHSHGTYLNGFHETWPIMHAEEAFEAWARAQPNNCVFLVDTYDTLEGVRRAADVALRLRERGHEPIGVRLDSGDLAWLSIEARRILDERGLDRVRILASNDLDEHLIASLKEQGARIDVWGVGTKMVTAYDQPALGGVYKLSAVREPGGEWEPRVKVSEQAAKVTTPGLLQVRRFTDESGRLVGDMLYDELVPPGEQCVMVDPADPTRRTSYCADHRAEELLVPVFEGGRAVYDVPPLAESRARTAAQLSRLDASHLRLLNPHVYKVGVELGLYERKMALIMAARGIDTP